MANVLHQVIYAGEINGRLDGTMVPIVVSAATSVGTDGARYPASEAVLVAAIQAANLHNKKANVVHRVYSAVLRDDKTISNQA